MPEHLVVTAGADTASAEINIRSGEIKSIEILDTNGNKITGDIILSRYDVYEFDAVGYDEFGNTIEIFPAWTVDSYLGTLDTVNPDNAGILTAGGTGTGKIRIQLGNFSDDQQVMVRPKLLSTDPADGAINIPLDADVRLVFTNNIDPSTVNTATLRVKRLEGTVEHDVPGSFVVYNEFVSFVPDSLVPLQQFTYYKVEVTGGIHETGGTPVTPFTYTFRTVWVQGTVTYYGNGNDGGTVPVDTMNYGENAVVTVLDNTGGLTLVGHYFAGWNTAPDGTGATYTVGQTFNITVIGASLYALWFETTPIMYNGNGNTGGTAPVDNTAYVSGSTVTAMGKATLVKMQDGISLLFTGWNTAPDGSGTFHAAGSTFVMGATNITLYAQWSILRGTGPAGGRVFYDKGSYSGGWRYMEAAPYDQSDGMGWGMPFYLDGQFNGWQSYDAVDLCNNLILAGYSDWFLPTENQLSIMYTNLKNYNVGGFTNGWYWSSYYLGNNPNAWALNFSNGVQGWADCWLNYRVRAVRQF